MTNKVWIIGAGNMAVDYANVLLGLDVDFEVIGRGKTSAIAFEEKVDKKVIRGGLTSFLAQNPAHPSHCIVALPVNSLASSCEELLAYGVKSILVEKPGGLNVAEIEKLAASTEAKEANIYVAYNRRFYASVLKAQEIIAQDGGVTSFNFEFTEWAHVIEKLDKPKEILSNWFLANSTHIVDAAFFLGGLPTQMTSLSNGSLSWHDKSNFVGCGETDQGALFSYAANWDAPGRWVVEMLTNQHRLLFKPIETLQIQKKGSVRVEPVELDDSLDKNYKPGLFLQTQTFLAGDKEGVLLEIQNHARIVKNIYAKIVGNT